MEKLNQVVYDLTDKEQEIERLSYLKNFLVDLEQGSHVEFTVKDITIRITKESFPDGYPQFTELVKQYILQEINVNAIS